MKRHVCVHGHFYQPPRENPWLEFVEMQDSAYPYHDWNQRITVECYAPNTASRILDRQNKIIDIVSNYSQLSFNFGPTLLSWLQRQAPQTYRKIIEADVESRKRFSGHGSAIAQVYNHMIMPLANSRDKRTQIEWGIKDFEHRFGRRPEGMWLAETAVDLETLDIMSEYGISFTILSPYQAGQTRKIGEKDWTDATGGKVDPKHPYFCLLPSGRSINIFFYDGPVAQDIAFGGVLDNGEKLAERLINTFSSEQLEPQLAHVATDGETYGHHHRYGEMALSYALDYIQKRDDVRLTIYSEYLDNFPPIHEVRIVENSSWSCAHGVERWRADCGCRIGGNEWNQAWRGPLRGAMDWLRDSLIEVFEDQATDLLRDPWKARDAYIQVILNRHDESVSNFLKTHTRKELSPIEKVKVLKLLEMQRHAMLMFTSCGWFFDEISGIETVQIMEYAGRSIQLAREVSGIDLEPAYIELLKRAPSNIPEMKNGGKIYEQYVRSAILDLPRVAAHYAISSLFEEYPKKTRLYSYSAESISYDRVEAGKQKMVTGKARVRSFVTCEEEVLSFVALHLGGHNLFGGIRRFEKEEEFIRMRQEMEETFNRNDLSAIMHNLDHHFNDHNYSLWHLFKDEQRKIFNQILGQTLRDIESSFRQINQNHYPVMKVMKDMGIPRPKVFTSTFQVMFDADLKRELENERLDMEVLRVLVKRMQEWQLTPDRTTLSFVASNRINWMMKKFFSNHEDPFLLKKITGLIQILDPLQLQLNLWEAQNLYFNLSQQVYRDMKVREEQGDQKAEGWLEWFSRLSEYLKVRIK